MNKHDHHFCDKCHLEICECQVSSFDSSFKQRDCCPELIATPRFPSPNSPLPQEELDELQECIEIANQLLRSLGNRPNPNNLRQLQLHLLDLRKFLVRIKVNGLEDGMDLVGELVTAGRDFVLLNTVGKRTFIPFSRIQSLQYENMETNDIEPQELINANRQFKRELVLHFGEVVSGNPKLVNLFFGIPLHFMLSEWIGCKVRVYIENQGEKVKGELFGADENSIQIFREKEMKQIQVQQICFIEMSRN